MARADYWKSHNLSDYIAPTMEDEGLLNSSDNASAHVAASNNFNPPFSLDDPGLAMLQDCVRSLQEYYIPSIYVAAIVGNVFSMVVLTGPVFKCFSTTQYLYGILLSETLHCLALLHSWLEEIGVDTGTYQIGGWCQFATFVTSIAEFLSIWYTVVLLVDRAIWTCLKSRTNPVCLPLRAKVVLVGLAVIAIVVYLNISILYGTIVVGSRLLCTTLHTYNKIHDHLSKGDVLFNGLFPLLSILLLLIIIYNHVLCERRRKSDGDVIQLKSTTHIIPARINGVNSNNGYSSHSVSATFINQIGFFSLFALIFVLLSAPYDLFRLYQAIGDLTRREHDQKASLKSFLLLQIFQYLKFSKYAVNVLILVTAYPLFRSATVNLAHRAVTGVVSLCKGSGKTHQSHSIETTFPEEV
jgi:hypothetical protein